MTGFVDPEFSRLKTTAPGFHVWRVSRDPNENYDVKPVKNELHGEFFDGESYIVFSSSRFKVPHGSCAKVSSRKMEMHVHFWLGSKLTEDECRRTIIKVTELDDVLGGGASLYREMQGYESSRFLSYFKNRMNIRQGNMVAAAKQREINSKAKLHKLTERSVTLILTEQPSISWNHLEAEGVYVLETPSRFFIWIGKSTKIADKRSAIKFLKRLEFNTKKTIIWVQEDDEKEMNEEDRSDFEEYLKLDSKSLKSATCNASNGQANMPGIIKLYELVMEDDLNTITHVKDGPLEQSDLNPKRIHIINHKPNSIWVWVGKRITERERSRAINVGIAYCNEKVKSSSCNGYHAIVARVVDGTEPNEFKLLFKNWTQSFAVIGQDFFAKKITKPVNATFTADRLWSSPFLAAETQLLDYGSGKMKVVRVNGNSLEPMKPEEFGIFHSGFSYLIHYSYIVCDRTDSVLYYWLGKNAPQDEKSATIWPSLEKIPDLKDTNVQVRIKEDKETPHFNAIFQGKMIVLNRSVKDQPTAGSSQHPLDKFPVLLLKIDGGDVCNVRSVEVEPVASSLTTYGVFLLRTPKISYLWCGLSSGGDEREMGNRIANKWTSTYTVVLEGHETKLFWDSLNGQGDYFGKEKEAEVSINFPPRMYKCSSLCDSLSASEVINFTQSDLSSGGIFILDSWTLVFVWTGSDVTDDEKLSTEKMAQEYLALDPRHRDLDIPIVHVRQGHEPPIFVGFFPSWQFSSAQHRDDGVYQNYLKAAPTGEPNLERSSLSEHPGTTTPDHETPDTPEKYPIDLLRHKPVEDLPPNVDPLHREAYLSDEEFTEAFGMPRKSFNNLPQWKRKNLKISAGLF